MTTPDTGECRLAELRRDWLMWSAVRTDRCVNYLALPITEDELAAADGSVLVAAYQVRDARLAEIEDEAARIKALHCITQVFPDAVVLETTEGDR